MEHESIYLLPVHSKEDKARREREENTRTVQRWVRAHQEKRDELAELDAKRAELSAEVKTIGRSIRDLNDRNEKLNQFLALAEEI